MLASSDAMGITDSHRDLQKFRNMACSPNTEEVLNLNLTTHYKKRETGCQFIGLINIFFNLLELKQAKIPQIKTFFYLKSLLMTYCTFQYKRRFCSLETQPII